MLCYLCKFNADNWKSLVYHFKIFHFLKTDSNYTCCEGTCTQSFLCLASFKRHIQNKHFPENILLNNQPRDQSSLNSSILPNNTENLINDYLLTDNLTNTPFDFDLVSESLYKSAIEFVVNLHNNNNFTRVDIIDIQTSILDKIMKPIVSMLKNLVDDEINEPIKVAKFHRIASVKENSILYCNTEYRLVSWLINNELLFKINQFTINNEIGPVQYNGESVYNEKITKGVLLPLQFQFKKFFEHGDNFKEQYTRFNHYKNNQSTSIEHFVQGSLWQQKVSLFSDEKIIIPFFLYMDEFEINNPSGLHATFQSISAIYYSFPLAENNSKLSTIFLAALVKHIDIKSFSNDKCLQSLINEINILENEGINIKTRDGNFHVHFVLDIILGDNLGLNSLLEFSKSFSANFFCRFCKASKASTIVMHEEDLSLMRNAHNYSDDVASMNFSEIGIYQELLLNQVTGFHVTQNYCIDIMHDLFEGVCHYDLCNIIMYYIVTAKLFSLETLNNRKMNFNYEPIEIGNISPPI